MLQLLILTFQQSRQERAFSDNIPQISPLPHLCGTLCIAATIHLLQILDAQTYLQSSRTTFFSPILLIFLADNCHLCVTAMCADSKLSVHFGNDVLKMKAKLKGGVPPCHLLFLCQSLSHSVSLLYFSVYWIGEPGELQNL